MKKKVLLSSILTIALCLSLIAGSTFALFTSESTVNVAVTAGEIDLTATVDPQSIVYESTLVKGKLAESTATFAVDTNTVTIDKMVPGDVIKFNILLDNNNTNVAFNYRAVIDMLGDDGLWSGLVVKFSDLNDTKTEKTLETYDGNGKKYSEWTLVAANAWTDKTVEVEITLPEDRGNEYQKKTCSFCYTIQAVQGNAPLYDSAADVQGSLDDGGMISQFGDTVDAPGCYILANEKATTIGDIVLDGSDMVLDQADGSNPSTIAKEYGKTDLTLANGAEIIAPEDNSGANRMGLFYIEGDHVLTVKKGAKIVATGDANGYENYCIMLYGGTMDLTVEDMDSFVVEGKAAVMMLGMSTELNLTVDPADVQTVKDMLANKLITFDGTACTLTVNGADFSNLLQG